MNLFYKRFSLKDRESLIKFMVDMDWDEDDVDAIIGGRHRRRHFEVVVYMDGCIEIKHKKTRKIVWSM